MYILSLCHKCTAFVALVWHLVFRENGNRFAGCRLPSARGCALPDPHLDASADEQQDHKDDGCAAHGEQRDRARVEGEILLEFILRDVPERVRNDDFIPPVGALRVRAVRHGDAVVEHLDRARVLIRRDREILFQVRDGRAACILRTVEDERGSAKYSDFTG